MKLLAVIVNCVWVLALIPAGIMAMMSPMMFDAPGSDKNSFLWGLLLAMMLLPLLILITQIFAWIKFFAGNYPLSFKIGLIPLIDVAVIIYLFIVWGNK
jgi:hypothetical protein